MNKELFVSSTPHETKVGLVEDDLLAEIYLERENEYTLAGSIYKGRVTRVLPGMQSAFVDIGLERDAFLYVSDFMELEEHDEDLTDVVPANRGVQDMRPQPARVESASADAQSPVGSDAGESQADSEQGSDQDFGAVEGQAENEPSLAAGSEPTSAGPGQDRERGGWRGRRRRRGGRRDGRSEGRDRGTEPRPARPVESAPAVAAPRAPETGRAQQFGPLAGYEPILLPGESISKYRGMAPAPGTQERHSPDSAGEVGFARTSTSNSESTAPVAATFPDDEPIFAVASPAPVVETPREKPEHSQPAHQERAEAVPAEIVSTSVEWNREFRRPEPASPEISPPREAAEEFVEEDDEMVTVPEHSDQPGSAVREPEAAAFAAPVFATPVFATPVFATPGTLEEETIDDEEADSVHYEQSSDEGYDEFEEETRAAGQMAEVRATVDEIHMSSLAEAGGAPPEGSAPAGTAGYTQRAPRPRPGFDRQRGGRRGGGRRFPRREAHEIPKISDLLKEGQEILVQIAKEPIGKKGARITSHIALPGRFLVYMPTVNHTGVSRKIASDEERQRLKRIVMSERENGHGGFIVRTAAQNAAEEDLRADIRFLKGLWAEIKSRADAGK